MTKNSDIYGWESAGDCVKCGRVDCVCLIRQEALDSMTVKAIKQYLDVRIQRDSEVAVAARAAKEQKLREHEAEVARLKKELGKK